MIAHPLLVAIGLVDLASLVLLLSAARAALRVVLSWAPTSATREQLALEARADTSGGLARAAAWLWALSTLAWMGAVAVVLPDLVPGAMCGTGVLAAMHEPGARALTLRALALAAFGAWSLLDRLDRQHALSPLTPTTARTLLLVVPLVALALLATLQGFAALDPHHEVSCCTAVYGTAAHERSNAASWSLPAPALVAAWLGGAALLAGLTALRLRRLRPSSSAGLVLASLSVLWSALSALVLLRVLAAYHYGVLQHHCPWCLLRPEHRLVGLPLFAASIAVLVEGVGAAALDGVARRHPGLSQAVEARSRRGALRLLLALLIVLVLAGGPALLWRLRFGVWM